MAFARIITVYNDTFAPAATSAGAALSCSLWLNYTVSVCTLTFVGMVFFPYLMGFMSRVDRSGTLAGMSLVAQTIGAVIGPLVAAQLFDFGRSWIFVFVSVSYILTAIILLPIVRHADTLSPRRP